MVKKLISFLASVICVFSSCNSNTAKTTADPSQEISAGVREELQSLGYVEADTSKRTKEELKSLGYIGSSATTDEQTEKELKSLGYK